MIKQPNKFTCLPTALAILVNDDPMVIIDYIGHDGSRLVNGTAIAYHPDEIIDVAWELYYIPLTLVSKMPILGVNNEKVRIWKPDYELDRINKYLEYDCIIMDYMKEHAYAWKRGVLYNPTTGESQDMINLLHVTYMLVVLK